MNDQRKFQEQQQTLNYQIEQQNLENENKFRLTTMNFEQEQYL